jgi:hypothetical protein
VDVSDKRRHELVVPWTGHVRREGDMLVYRLTDAELSIVIDCMLARQLGLKGISGLPVKGRG